MNINILLENRDICDTKRKNLHIAIFTVLWYLFAHGYRMANNMFSHDSLLEIYQDDSAWQIALGRWAHPILIFLRGGLTNPWLICMLSLGCFVLTACLLADCLHIREGKLLFLMAGVVVCNPAVICTNASFLQCVDFYSFSLLLSVMGVWLCKRKNVGNLVLGILMFTASMAIYQAYICVAIGLIFILLYEEATATDTFLQWVKKGSKYGICLVTSVLVYWCVWQIFLKVFGIWTANTYNGMSEVGSFSFASLPGLVWLAYKRVWDFFWSPQIFSTMVFHEQSLSFVWLWILRFCNFLIILLLIYFYVKSSLDKEKKNSFRIFAQGLLLVAFPLGINFVCVLTKGMEHTLMIYAFVLVYIFCLYHFQSASVKEKILKGIGLMAVLCFVWINVVYANQTYLKKNLQNQAMASMMTRIVSRIEQTERYEPGITPVAFSGYFEYSPYLKDLQGFEEVLPYGMGKTTLTYMGTDYAFLKYEMNVPINEQRVMASDERVKKMPCFPLEGSVQYVDDILVVKISD